MSTTDHPAYCARQARKTPRIPWHNGLTRCTACHRELTIIPWGAGHTVTARTTDAGSSAAVLLVSVPGLAVVVWFVAQLLGEASSALSLAGALAAVVPS